jgi:hypothetical protein
MQCSMEGFEMVSGVVRWDARARLEERIHPNTGFGWCGTPRHDGTLAGAVRAFMKLHADSQSNCDVFTDVDAVEGAHHKRGLLGFAELSALAKRPDLPKH